MPVDLRPRLHFLAGREIVENARENFGGQILVEIVIDLRHWRIHAGAEALHLDPGQGAVRRHVELVTDALLTDVDQVARTAQPARVVPHN